MMNTMNATAIAIVIAGALIALGLHYSTPRYELTAITNSSNPAVWKLDKFSGDVYLCATPGSKDAESACTAKMKQY